MEVNRFLLISVLISILTSCSNTSELETGEIKTLARLGKAFSQSNQPKQFIDARLLLDRKQIDEAEMPILFVELPSGQNGTLTPYPGKGSGQTWLGADGATITLDRGVLKASRGLGNDLMGSTSSMPPWSKIENKKQTYSREFSHITGNNKISKQLFDCEVVKNNDPEIIKVWGIDFNVSRYKEYCEAHDLKFTNSYYLDNNGIVRQSHQYHSETHGYIFTQRIDR